MSNQQKFIQTLLSLALAGVITGCSGSGDANDTKTVTSSTALAVAPQGLIQNDDTYCTDPLADPDGDGWGWENGQSCTAGTADATPTTTATVAANTTTQTGSDLPVGIVYYLWHCTATAKGQQYNITEVLNGESNWGPGSSFHWWDKPDTGYYCLGDQPNVVANHLTMLGDAGVDFLVLDITNHPNTASFDAETFILKSLRTLLEVASTIPNSPKIVPWVPLTNQNAGTIRERDNLCNSNGNSAKCQSLHQSQPMYQHFTNVLTNQYPELTFEYEGKPLILEAANDNKYPRAETDVVRPQLENNWTVERMWGLQLTNNEWSFLSTCENPVDFYETKGWSAEGCNQPVNAGNQISVTAAYQYTYISESFETNPNSYAGYTGGMPKFHGRTMAQQFRVAFENRDTQPMVILTGWNEWIAQRKEYQGRVTFVDLYDAELNRDIEPGGVSGDLYYYLMRDLITEYRNNKPFAFEDYFLTKNSILDTNYYWNAYGDLQAAFDKNDNLGIRNHWLTIGMKEGRRPSVAFDANHYRNSYGDLAGLATPQALLNHFIDSGFQEGRTGSADFHAATYLKRYPQLKAAYGNNGYYKSFKHFVSLGQSANHNPKP